MLRYKVKLNDPKQYNEIECKELYLSPDLSFISGVTDTSYDLINGQLLKIEYNNDEHFHDVYAEINNVVRQGYVMLQQTFVISDFNDVYKGFRYVDGKYYFCGKEASKIKVLGKEYDIEGDIVKVPTRYWVENFKVKIADIVYDVDIQLQFNNDLNDYEVINPPYVTIKGGEMLPVIDYKKELWKKVTKFYIHKEKDYNISLDMVSCTKKFPYFIYGANKTIDYSDNNKILNYENKKYYLILTNDGSYQVTTNDGKTFIQQFDKAVCNEEEYNLEYEWRNTSVGKHINLFVNNPQYKFVSSQKILAETPTVVELKCDLINDSYIIYCGKKYHKSEDTVDFIIYDGIEYQITYTDNTKYIYDNDVTSDVNAYIIYNNMPLGFKIENNKAKRITNVSTSTDKTNEHDIKKYNYIEIDNEKFLIKEYDNLSDGNEIGNISFVNVIKKQKFILSIDEVINGNLLRCHVITDNDCDDSGICGLLASNFKKFIFKLYNPLFEDYNISEDNFILSSVKNEEEIFDVIKLFNPSNYIKIPLITKNNIGTNVRQEDLLNNVFFKKEKEKAINPYVDMEREIFYPCSISGHDEYGRTQLELINEITFDLHFRSRNLNNWKINEDVFGQMDKTSKNALKTKFDWNIFDTYKEYNKEHTYSEFRPSIKGVSDYKYYQPSDLLHFLNFTDDDIFYQKSKVGKSFLRLLFFDSNDMANQNLLYSCTVWMDEGKLYKTYIDNIYKKDNKYVSVSEELNEKEIAKSSAITVYNDTCDDDGNVTFEADKRLAARFVVKNRYEMSESAEGFYLYIFKDYCEKLHEQTIYMKVEFNHAGEGRTVNFLMPFKYSGNTFEPVLMDLLPGSTDFEEFKKGYKLKELYEHLFIPINIVYDDINNRYSYYLPNGLVQHNEKGVMKFNLYELKIRDESDETINGETNENNI